MFFAVLQEGRWPPAGLRGEGEAGGEVAGAALLSSGSDSP
jgi:hypothetical protein